MKRLFPLAFLLLGCAHSNTGTFWPGSFRSNEYPYRVRSVKSDSMDLVGRDWIVANFSYKDGIPTANKLGPDYEIVRHYDNNDDGKDDETATEPFYELLLAHKRQDAEIWLRIVPLAWSDAEKDPATIAARYLEAVSGSGAVAVQFGAEGPTGTVSKRFASRRLGSGACSVSAHAAYWVDFEIANVDQLQLSKASRWIRMRLVVLSPRFVHETPGPGDARIPTVMLVGYAAPVNDFVEFEAVFDAFVGRIEISKTHAPNRPATAARCGPSPAVAAQPDTSSPAVPQRSSESTDSPL